MFGDQGGRDTAGVANPEVIVTGRTPRRRAIAAILATLVAAGCGSLSTDATRKLALSNAHGLVIIGAVGVVLCLAGGGPFLLLFKRRRTVVGYVGMVASGLVFALGSLAGAIVLWLLLDPKPLLALGTYDQGTYDRAFYRAAWEPASVLVLLAATITLGVLAGRSVRRAQRNVPSSPRRR